MESNNNNNNNNNLQNNNLDGSSLDFPNLSVGDNNHTSWRPTPTFLLNNTIHATCDNEASPSSFNNTMIQDLRYSLPNNINIQPIISQHDHHNNNHHLISNQMKEESSTSSDQSNNSSFQSFNDMLSPSTTPNEMLLLNTLSPTYKNLMHGIYTGSSNNNSINNIPSLGGISTGMTNFSQIFPSVNISKLSSNASMDSSNFRGGLDLFASERFLGGVSDHNQASNSNFLDLFKENSQFEVDHDLQQSNDLKLSNNSNNLSSFNNNNGVLESKRPSCIDNVEPKSPHQTTFKKQRFEPRASCPPLKVRKEKLGDRIAALQQLVAPFGKTDTASVLWETIGYIKFLQSQVETLSVPYMKLGLRNKSSNNLQRVSDNEIVENETDKQDLKSRGLCLVPLTCMSYITNEFEINGGAWPTHHFNPGF